MADLKPTGVKAPLHLIPARSLRHVAACMEHGVITKGAPWNWQVYDDLETRKNEYISAAMRHLICIGDPSESDLCPDSGLNHAGHAIAGLLIYLWLCQEDYRKSKAAQEQTYTWTGLPENWHVSGTYTQPAKSEEV